MLSSLAREAGFLARGAAELRYNLAFYISQLRYETPYRHDVLGGPKTGIDRKKFDFPAAFRSVFVMLRTQKGSSRATGPMIAPLSPERCCDDRLCEVVVCQPSKDTALYRIVTRRADLGASLTEAMQEASRLYEVTPWPHRHRRHDA